LMAKIRTSPFNWSEAASQNSGLLAGQYDCSALPKTERVAGAQQMASRKV
jgi:hypothetical protein